MNLDKVKIGQSVIARRSDGSGSVFIKIKPKSYYHAISIDIDEEWSDMKSNYSYGADQLELSGDLTITNTQLVGEKRIKDCIKYVFEKMKA